MKDLITEARELCEKATPGEWEVNHLDDCFIEPRICEIPANGCYDYKMVEANSMFIARSRTLIPELCDALEKATVQNAAMYGALEKIANNSSWMPDRKWATEVLRLVNPGWPAPPEKEGE